MRNLYKVELKSLLALEGVTLEEGLFYTQDCDGIVYSYKIPPFMDTNKAMWDGGYGERGKLVIGLGLAVDWRSSVVNL